MCRASTTTTTTHHRSGNPGARLLDAMGWTHAHARRDARDETDAAGQRCSGADAGDYIIRDTRLADGMGPSGRGVVGRAGAWPAGPAWFTAWVVVAGGCLAGDGHGVPGGMRLRS